MKSADASRFALDLPAVDVEAVDRLVGEGRTLPAALYTEPIVAELEDRLIFRSSWQAACTELDLRAPGDFVTLTISSVPLVVIRDDEDRVNAFVNVCRHRSGRVVADGHGSCKRMQCPYHGWTYGLDGSLQGAPGFAEGLPSFDTLGLRKVPVERWAGLVFVSLEPTQSLLEQLGELPEVMRDTGYEFPFADAGMELVGDYELEIAANWKLYHENNCECYHCATTHKDSFCSILKTREIEGRGLEGGSSMLRIPLRDHLLDMYSSDQVGQRSGYEHYLIWPNAYVITGHVGEMLYRIDPRGHNRSRVTGRVYRRPGVQPEELTAILDEANQRTVEEDKEMVEGVQIGLESGYAETGPTLPVAEVILRAFYRDVWNTLRPAFT